MRSAHQGAFATVMSSFELAWLLLGVATSWRVVLLVALSVLLVLLFSRLFSVARVLFF